MADFKIGSQSLCIKSHSDKLVLEGKKYKILGMQYLCEHYPLVLYVNHEPTANLYPTTCPHCKRDSGGKWVCASRFELPQEKELSEIKIEYKVVDVDKSVKEKREEVIFNN